MVEALSDYWLMPKKAKKMFEQIKHNMETITGVAIYPILSLLIFFLFFVGLGIWVSSYKKEKIKELSNIPLDDSIKK